MFTVKYISNREHAFFSGIGHFVKKDRSNIFFIIIIIMVLFYLSIQYYAVFKGSKQMNKWIFHELYEFIPEFFSCFLCV